MEKEVKHFRTTTAAAAFAALIAGPALAQDGTSEWLAYGEPLDPASCIVTEATAGAANWDPAGYFDTGLSGAVPGALSDVDISVTSVSEVNVVPDGIYESDGTTLWDSVIGANYGAQSSLIATNGSTGAAGSDRYIIDTPDTGSDTIDLLLGGRINPSTLIPTKGGQYVIRHHLTCILTAQP